MGVRAAVLATLPRVDHPATLEDYYEAIFKNSHVFSLLQCQRELLDIPLIRKNIFIIQLLYRYLRYILPTLLKSRSQ